MAQGLCSDSISIEEVDHDHHHHHEDIHHDDDHGHDHHYYYEDIHHYDYYEVRYYLQRISFQWMMLYFLTIIRCQARK